MTTDEPSAIPETGGGSTSRPVVILLLVVIGVLAVLFVTAPDPAEAPPVESARLAPRVAGR